MAGATGASAPHSMPILFPSSGEELDFRPLLQAVVGTASMDRIERSRARSNEASPRPERALIEHSARPRSRIRLCFPEAFSRTNCCSRIFKSFLADDSVEIWTNHAVPPNDGGISLGQAALAAFGQYKRCGSIANARGANSCMSCR